MKSAGRIVWSIVTYYENTHILRGFFKAEASLASLQCLSSNPCSIRSTASRWTVLISLCILSFFSIFIVYKNFADFLALQHMKFRVKCFFTFIVHVLIFCPFVLSYSLSHCSFCRFTRYHCDLHFLNVSVISGILKLTRLATKHHCP